MMTILGACAVEPTGDPIEAEADVEADSADEAEVVQDLAASCVVVTTCNAPGPDGARCRQQPGCPLNQAVFECGLQVVATCGFALCPVILIRPDGTRRNICAS